MLELVLVLDALEAGTTNVVEPPVGTATTTVDPGPEEVKALAADSADENAAKRVVDLAETAEERISPDN